MLLLPGAAWADVLTPEDGPTPNAQKIDELYKIVFFIGMAVIGAVWAVLLYSLFRFRARRGRQAPQISGNTPLEIGWTVAATAIVAVITIVTYIYLDDITHPVASGPEAVAEARDQYATINQPPPPGGKSLDIQVSGQQFLWRYQYPNQAVVLPGDGGPARHHGDADAEGQRRDPLVVDPGAGRQARRRARATRTRPGSRRPRPARSRASAPSCAAAPTTR